MSQTSVNVDHDKAFAGMKADSRFDHIDSKQAYEDIGIGLIGVIRSGSHDEVRLPKQNRATIVWDADFVTSNKINGTINGTAITEVDFDTDQDTTIEAVRAAIEALDDVDTAVLTDTGGDNRTIRVNAVDGTAITSASFTVTGGASQADETVTYTTIDDYGENGGIILHTHTLVQDSDGNVQYDQYEAVNFMRQGSAYVLAEEAVSPGDTVYVRHVANGAGKDVIGKIRNDSDSNTCTAFSALKIIQTISSAGVVQVEINLP